MIHFRSIVVVVVVVVVVGVVDVVVDVVVVVFRLNIPSSSMFSKS